MYASSPFEKAEGYYMGWSLAALTVQLPTAAVTTIILSLGLSGLGFFAGGYYAGHATVSDETSAGVRRIWIAVLP